MMAAAQPKHMYMTGNPHNADSAHKKMSLQGHPAQVYNQIKHAPRLAIALSLLASFVMT